MKFAALVRLTSAPNSILNVSIDGNRVNASQLYDDMDFNEARNKTYV